MNVNYFDIEGLNLKDEINFSLIPIGLFEGDRDVIMNDLFSPGQSYNKGKNKEKKLILKGYIKGDILTNLFLLKQYLFKDGLKKMTVSIAGMPMFYLMVDLLSWASDEINPELISCQLVAPDPYLYELISRDISLGAVSNSGLTFPLTFPVSFGDVSGGKGTLTNVGNAVSYPVITIVGTCSNITVTNTTTGESMSLDISLLDADTLVIDCRPDSRGIYLNGNKRMDLKNGSWFSCPPGDNVFTFQRTSLQTKQHCSVELKSRWI